MLYHTLGCSEMKAHTQTPNVMRIKLSQLQQHQYGPAYHAPPSVTILQPMNLHMQRPADNQGQPLNIVNGLYEGDRFRPYLPAINPNVTDSRGRPFPGNAAEAAGQQAVVCSSDGSVRVRIIDSCPCTQVGA
jgi:hypothetical protein